MNQKKVSRAIQGAIQAGQDWFHGTMVQAARGLTQVIGRHYSMVTDFPYQTNLTTSGTLLKSNLHMKEVSFAFLLDM
jgi:hypothetical protein